MAALTVDRQQVRAFRLAGHNLTERRPLADLPDVAAACGIRDSPPGSALLGFGARIAGMTTAALDQALEQDRTLVDVLAMRASPTIVPARDIAVFTLGALPDDEQSIQAAVQSLGPRLKEANISATQALELATAAGREVASGVALTRGGLSAGMTKLLPEALTPYCKGCKSVHVHEMLFRLVGVSGVFVIAPGSRYTGTDRWLGGWPEMERAAARQDLLRRYLRCFGPSTVDHFAAWVGVSRGDAGRAWDSVAGELTEVMFEHKPAAVLTSDADRLEHARLPEGVRLLPPYDSYLDQRDRATIAPDPLRQKQLWRVLGNPGAVLVDGEIVGLWRPKKKGKRLTIAVEMFQPLAAGERDGVQAEAEIVAALRGCAEVAVTYAG